MVAALVRTLSALLLISFIATAAPANTEGTKIIDVDHLNIYGATVRLARDNNVPGEQVARVGPRLAPGEDWSSGVALPLPIVLNAGGRVSSVFWARAERPTAVPVTLQGGAPSYRSFARTMAHLTPRWQRFVISGVAPSNFPARSQALTVQLGKAQTEVSLGPVMFTPGKPDNEQIEAALAGFQPPSVAEDVSIPSDAGVVLAGTLRTPRDHGSGPFPIAICVQGHGPNGRGGYNVLTDRLLADGIATLVYDKRGIDQSTGTYSEDMNALTRDARAVVAAMRRRADIDGSRVAIVGHSQGGAIAPALAAADPKIAAIVTLAGPVGDGLALFRREMDAQLIASGHSESTVRPLVEASIAFIRARIDHADAATIAPLQDAIIGGFVTNGFTREQAAGALAAIDRIEVYQLDQARIASDLRSLRIPVLAVFGSLDPIVVARTNAAAAKEALAQNPAGKVVVFDGLSHWFKEGAKTGSEAESAMLGANVGSPRVVGLVSDWLRDALAASVKKRPEDRSPGPSNSSD